MFKQIKPTDFSGQKGCDITVEKNDIETIFNVWSDILDNGETTIRVTQNNDDELLIAQVDTADFMLPVISYSEDKTYCYVTFKNHSVHIKLDDECVVFDVWGLTDSESESIDSTYIAYEDLESKEQNYISIYGFKTESDLESDNESHIDSITQNGEWEDCVLSIIADNKDNYYHISVQSDDGKPLSSFQ